MLHIAQCYTIFVCLRSSGAHHVSVYILLTNDSADAMRNLCCPGCACADACMHAACCTSASRGTVWPGAEKAALCFGSLFCGSHSHICWQVSSPCCGNCGIILECLQDYIVLLGLQRQQ